MTDGPDPARVAVPDGVRLTQDIPYRGGDSLAWRLDLAMPSTPARARRPGIVFVHGGGWHGGDKSGEAFLGNCLAYAAKGYVCISVNYRLSGEAPFPAAVEDIKCAVRWLRAHGAQYGLDADRIGAMGVSAGGHLVSMLGLVPREAGLEGDGPYRDRSSRVQAVVDVCGPSDFGAALEGEQRTNDPDVWRRFLGGSDAELRERQQAASPVTYVARDAPPFLIVHGTADPIVPVAQADALFEALEGVGADVTYLRIDGAGHGVWHEAAGRTEPAMDSFFARVLGQPAPAQLTGEDRDPAM
jgi:acetyl esterase/lipase